MSIPDAIKIKYPETIDNDENLFLVKDSLRLPLLNNYKPKDNNIVVSATENDMAFFPPSGIITLTEQCSDPNERAISFFYESKNDKTQTFNNVKLLDGFPDVEKIAKITNVTLNVVAEHHNNIKDAIIQIEKFAGIKGDKVFFPKIGSMEARINYLRAIALKPKVWFNADIKEGIIPLKVIFTDLSFRLATDNAKNPIVATWDFGDGEIRTLNFKNDSEATTNTNTTVTKVYELPGSYTVTYTIKNKFGQDELQLKNYINAKFVAPDNTVLFFEPKGNQISFVDLNKNVNSPFSTIRSPVNTIIDLKIPDGINPNTQRTFSGEEVNSNGNPIDPVVLYNWELNDDLVHGNSKTTQALYETGGIYDAIIRVDTESNSFRITNVLNAIDIVENVNMWHWLYKNQLNIASGSPEVQASEFSLISEVYKTPQMPSLQLNTNNNFLNNDSNSSRQKFEFSRNIGFCQSSLTNSGNSGDSFLFWASGRNISDSPTLEQVYVKTFNGFDKSYKSKNSFQRAYNWMFLNTQTNAYFLLGRPNKGFGEFTSPVSTKIETYNLMTNTLSSHKFQDDAFQANAIELKQNESVYGENGNNDTGNFSIYRSTWKGNTGYFLRSSLVGTQILISNLYSTIGGVNDPFIALKKLQDIPNSNYKEGQLLSMSNGLFFFNNSSNISIYEDSSNTWYVAGNNSGLSFRSLQDKTAHGFEKESNTLLGTSNGDHIAYLSFDYSENSIVKFNNLDLTFSKLSPRPRLEQWFMEIY
jgi:PKD repeat protein